MKRYLLHEAPKVAKEFRKHFGIDFKHYWAGWAVSFTNEILIDLVKFDDYLT